MPLWPGGPTSSTTPSDRGDPVRRRRATGPASEPRWGRLRRHGCARRLVITGEGSLDEQTLSGKAPAGVAAAALAAGVPVVTVSGRLALTDDQLRAAGIARAYALTDIEPDVQRRLADAGPLLERLVGQLARDWLAEPDPGSAPEVPTELEVDR